MQSNRISALLRWIESHGGGLHRDAEVQVDSITGLSVFATADIPSDERLISCPFELAVTPELAINAICEVKGCKEEDLEWPAGTSKAGAKWSDRMVIAGYFALHWASEDTAGGQEDPNIHPQLRHSPYIASLPNSEDLLTPLYFTESELELLRGSNLYGAVLDRRREWEEEYGVVRELIKEDTFTWQRYLVTATYLSSRAFPSKLLRLPDTGSATTFAIQTSAEEESHPVLLPGVDLFNHSRGQPIVWLSSITPSSAAGPTKTISLVSATLQRKGQQLYNNYGPKPNEELLLGYGFVIEDNPDDVVVLKVGQQEPSQEVQDRLRQADLDPSKRFFLKRDGKLDPDLLAILRIYLSPNGIPDDGDIDSEDEHALHEQEEKSMQLELDVLSTLGQMLDDKLEKLEKGAEVVEAREEVRRMCEIYRQGQIDILSTALEKIEGRVDRLEGMMDQGMGGCPCCS